MVRQQGASGLPLIDENLGGVLVVDAELVAQRAQLVQGAVGRHRLEGVGPSPPRSRFPR